MDKIQKVLINVGRKDLAQKYYKKIAERRLFIGLNDLKEIREDKPGQVELHTKDGWNIWIHPDILEDMNQISKGWKRK